MVNNIRVSVFTSQLSHYTHTHKRLTQTYHSTRPHTNAQIAEFAWEDERLIMSSTQALLLSRILTVAWTGSAVWFSCRPLSVTARSQLMRQSPH